LRFFTPKGVTLNSPHAHIYSRLEYKEWVIHSNTKIDLPEPSRVKDGSSIAIERMESLLTRDEIGQPIEQDCLGGRCDNQAGKWQADLLATNKGYYLHLEWFRKN
jgi:hypothetical protein